MILLSANRSGARRFDPLGVAFLEVLRPLQSGTTRATSAVGHLWSRYVSLVGVETENRELKERLRRLEGEHLRDSEVELENRRLAGLLDFKWEMPSQVVTARVIGKDASGIFESFTLDRGETDGIKPGMAVVCAEGVVGRIAQSTPHAARVLLISDHNSGVDAIVQRTRARGIVEGAVSRTCSMKYIKRGEEIDVNDVVVTSGLDGIFPKGVLIGRVSGVTRKDFGLFQVAEVAPAVDFSRLEEVLVLTSPPREVNLAIEVAERARATPEPTATPAPTPTPVAGAKRRSSPAPSPASRPTPRPTAGAGAKRTPQA